MERPLSAATTSLAASRRQGDGARRVSYQETRMTSSRLYDSDEDDDEIIEERMRQQEEAEEQALSERFGEAEEGPSGDGSKKRKKEESEKDIAKELDKEEQKKIKKVRPQLLPSNLTDHNGLIKLPIEFKRIKYKPKKGKKRDISAAAVYCNNLVNAYYSFCNDLFPSMNFEDVLLKIEQLGSKKEVKDYLQNMRNAARNEYLESLYGREKAERMLQELNDGLKLHERDDVERDMHMHMHSPMPDKPSVEEKNNVENAESSTLEREKNSSESRHYSGHKNARTESSPPSQTKQPDSEEQSDAEEEATFDEDDSSPTTEVAMQTDPLSEPQQEDANNNTLLSREPEDDDDDDDDEEEEATFDDVMEVNASTQRTPSVPDTRAATDNDDTAKSHVSETENEAPAANEIVTNKDTNEGVESMEQEIEVDVQESEPSKGGAVGDIDPSRGDEDASQTGDQKKESLASNEKDVSIYGLDQVENDKQSEGDQDIAEQKVAEEGSTAVVEDGVNEQTA